MSIKDRESEVLEAPGADERVAAIEDELRLAVALTSLREQAGLSQRELAERLGVTQPRVAAVDLTIPGSRIGVALAPGRQQHPSPGLEVLALQAVAVLPVARRANPAAA